MKIKVLCTLLGVTLMLGFGSLFAKEAPGQRSASLSKSTAQEGFRIITLSNVSNWEYWVRRDGQSAHTPAGSSGGFYPAGTASVIYQDGLMWGGFINDLRNPNLVSLRVGGQTYAVGTQPGHYAQEGTLTSEPVPSDANNAFIYRIRKDWQSLQIGDPALINDAASIFEVSVGSVTEAMQQEVLADYEWAWNNWPTNLGAPTEPDGTPGYAGGDQVIWFVANDNLAQDLYASPPLGLEMQVTLWAYNQPGTTLGQTVFKRFRLINKSGMVIDSMFVGQWSDPDVGVYTDDLVGCDVDLSLGFAYTGGLTDGDFDAFGLPPAAAGYDFFQGPIVDGVAGQDINGNGVDDSEDFATFGLELVGPGKVNLPMTSFGYFAAGTQINDPSFDYDGALEWYNLLNGFLPEINPTPYTYSLGPNAGQPTKFPLNGDPVKRTGDVDGFLIPPADRRMVLASGPFTMQPGDVQEIVVGVIGGIVNQPGGNNRNAVAQLKLNDGLAQFLFSTNFEGIPAPPASPDVKVAVTERTISLEWGSNTARVAQTESNDPLLGYNFEGYNIYQLPSRNSTLDQATKIATFDLNNTIDIITQKKFLPDFGDIVEVPVQAGTNTGIQRFFFIEKDFINDKPLFPGNEYYFAVTAYNVKDANGDGIVDTDVPEPALESNLNIIAVTPQGNKPGVRTGEIGPITVSHPAGKSDGVVTAAVINPLATTGAKYEIFFTEVNGEVLWNLRNTATGDVVLENQPQVDDVEAVRTQPIVDGIQVKVAGPSPGAKDWDIPSGTRRFTWANADFGFETFNGAIGWGSPARVFGVIPSDTPSPIPASELKDVVLKLAKVDFTDDYEPPIDPNDENVSYGYRYLRGAGNPPARPEFAQYITNPTSTYQFQAFEKNVPLSAWDVSDPDNPRRLAVGFLENNAENGLVDGKYWPGNFQNYDNTAGSGPREWLFIFDVDYSETQDPNLSDNIIFNDYPVMYWLTVNRRGPVPFSPGGSGEDQFMIISAKINTPNDVFEFQSPAVVRSDELAKQDLDKINVYPNPYYAKNPSETSRFERFVTFTNLPETDDFTVRIFSLGGSLVRKLTKADKITPDSQFLRWNLRNEAGLPVASGIYIAHVEVPRLGKTKVLKLFVVQGEEILEYY
jgi:hypothetical protein